MIELRISPTSELVLDDEGNAVGRVWEGATADGVKCFALVMLVAAHRDADLYEFEDVLLELGRDLLPPPSEVPGPWTR